MASLALYRVIWIPSGLALIGTVAAFALKPHPVAAVGEMVTFTSNDKTLSVRHPSNWISQSASVGGNSVEVVYKPTRNVEVRFSTDLEGSLLADISRSTASMPDTSNLPPELTRQLGQAAESRKTPLQTLHEGQQAVLSKVLENYHENETNKTKLAGLEALVTDFTCQTTDIFMRRTLVGRRYTALSNDRRVTAFYFLPKESEEKLGPTIRDMVKSLKIGIQGG